jgi:hypothetical protein
MPEEKSNNIKRW